MEKDGLPRYSAVDEYSVRRRIRRGPPKFIKLLVLSCLAYFVYTYWTQRNPADSFHRNVILSTSRLREDYAVCSQLRTVPVDPSGPRNQSARYVDGHGPVLIRNATVWTGEHMVGTTPEDELSGKGYSWINADVLMEYGLIKRVELGIAESELPQDCKIYDARGRQLTSGIVDMHSHTAVDTLPDLRGWSDDNELSNDITPYVRSIDAINPLDHHIQVIKSGGVTTSLILPGSGNNMGGEAYVIKHAVGKSDGRSEISAEDMLADPEKHWRYMKMACGENAKSVYGQWGRDFGPFSRMGEAWYFRHAFEQAKAMVAAQDDWCAAADKFGAESMDSYLPQELKWESLGALLRGQVQLNVHCYTIPDLESFVRHTNEWKFKVRAFHHAHQTYLVPEILKRAYGDRSPAAALFADNMYYKAEAYIASEHAGKILYDNGITPVYVSDNPVLNAQHVVFEAAKAYKNGLPYHVALAGVTSASAELLGLGSRVGKIKPGFDADVVVWDSDPLSIGAAPVQVWIDGTPQFDEPVELDKPVGPPLQPNVDLQEIQRASSRHGDVIFTGVSKVMLPGHELSLDVAASNVVVRNGSITCIGACEQEILAVQDAEIKTLPLRNGYIAPTLTAFGSSLGLVEITAEESTQDGENNDETISRAVDGLALDTKNLHAAYTHGVTKAITAPLYKHGGFKGVSVGFSTRPQDVYKSSAIWQDEVALHYPIAKTEKTPSLSSSVGLLKEKLLKAVQSNATDLRGDEKYLEEVVKGKKALVSTVHSADIITSLLRVKSEVEQELAQNGTSAMRWLILGGAESHLVADALADAKVGIVLAPLLAYSETWDQRRSLTGAPLTNGTTIDVLHAAGVKVAIGTKEDWETRNLFLTAGIAFANGRGKITEKDALAFVSTNIYDMLGLEVRQIEALDEFVVFEGSPLEIDGRLVAVADGNGELDLWT